jgi:putative ABC transport system substrate-binding protein
MATECLMKKGMTTPIVFASVNDPVAFHIVQSEASSGTMATGVKELLNFNEELAALLRYKPQIKKIMLVYNPAEPGMAKDQQEIARLLKEKSITLTSVAVFQTNELLAKVTPFMAETDALIVLKDNTVVAGLDALVKLCNRHQVPLMASDLDSPDKGAAFGYGVYEIDFGIEGAKKALQVINEGVAPTDIPVTAVSKFTLRVNSAAAQKQGIDVSKIQQQEEGR